MFGTWVLVTPQAEYIVDNYLDSLDTQLRTEWRHRRTGRRLSHAYQCRCGTAIFFRNTQCLTCGRSLGFVPKLNLLVTLETGSKPWNVRAAGVNGLLYKVCANRDAPARCNWLLDADDPCPLCVACRLNRTIPDLRDADNARYWTAIEIAKRRLVAQLLALGLPVRSRIGEDPDHGLMFDFLRSYPGDHGVMTGHANGLITLNAEEADDARRASIRYAMREPYRTLLGHLRHEVGHYYWDRLVRDTRWLKPFRALFGDERASYGEALKRNYEQGPPANWANAYISAYATMHPWEDWAETWAHYLHVVDSLGTALGFGLDAEDLDSSISPFTPADLYAPEDPNAGRFLELLNSWVDMIMVLNELARSMGHADFYPFVISRPVVAKLQFVSMVVVDSTR